MESNRTLSTTKKLPPDPIYTLIDKTSTNAVRQTRGNCFLVCSGGPVVVVYPDNVWYRKVTPELLDRIITEHLQHGTPVQEHVYHDG
jgi:(2Fe-2S) ferredoxin